MQDISIALVQSHLHWEDREANLAMFDSKLDELTSYADIIILPEMFSTGFSMRPQDLAEGMDGPSVSWMQQKAADKNAVITGSLIIEEKDAYFNRLIWSQPDGSLSWYNKRHLFSMAGEEKVYFPGNEKLIVEWKGWKICPMICYDLRFPVWTRNVENYDLLIFAANWPERRIQHWRKLLQARAIENQCYVAGVNRTGSDGSGINYTGNSMLVDPQGEIQAEIDNMESIAVCELKREVITHTRRYMPFLRDKDEFRLV
jgi:predicted amidohydrolase